EVKSTTEKSKQGTDQIKELSDQTNLISNEINVTMQEIATAASKQAESVEEGMTSIHELSKVIDEAKQNTQALFDFNQQIKEKQENGSHAIEALTTTMEENTTLSKSVGLNLDKLLGDIDNIAEMTNSIRAISQQ